MCPRCGEVDGMDNFEAGVCDGCFLHLMHEWAVGEKRKLDTICGACCGDEACPCNCGPDSPPASPKPAAVQTE